jgi:tetratricopeptide (TPR) repeat protein
VRLEAQQGNRRSALNMSTVLAGLTRDAWAGHAELLRAAGKLDQAETWYRRAIAARPGELATPLRLADLLAQRQRFPEVLDVLRELATRSVTGRLTSLRERARYFASWGLPAEALRCIEELDKLSAVAHPAVQVSQARAYASLGEADRARRIARAIPKHSPLHRRARQMLASLAEDPAERKAILAELAREHPGDPSIALQRMGVLQERNEHQQAAEVFLALRKRTGQAALPPTVLEMGLQALVDARRRQEAAELAAEVARASGEVHWRLRAALLGGATSAMPEPKQPHAKLLTYAIEMVRADKKVRPDELASARKKLVELAERLQTANESPRIRWMVLLADVAAGEVIEARRSLDAGFAGAPALREAAEELVALAEKSPSARREAARAMEATVADRLGMANLAERIADETLTDRGGAQWAAATIVSTNPKRRKEVLDTLEPEGTTLAKLIEADRLQEEGAFARSAERYREMLEDRPGDWALQQRLAMALERCDQQAQALALYETVWSASKSPAAANNAAYLVSQLHAEDPRQLARAMERVDHAIGQVGRAPSLLDTKGWLMHLRNDNEKAVYLLREAISQARDSAEIHYHLAVVEEALGNGSLAAMHYRSAVELVAAARREGRVVQPGDAKAAERARRALDARKEAA